MAAKLPKTASAAALQGTTFTPPKETIRPYRPEGLIVIAARPKKGKSWMVLDESIAVSSGGLALGRFPTCGGDVLYLALEDSPRRMQARMKVLLGDFPWPARMHFAHDWPRLDRGGLDALRVWLKTHPKAAMVIVDTFTRIRPPKGKEDSYQADAEATASLQRLALEFHVSIVLVLHQRKAAADDVFDSISGTLGMTASADVVSVLTRENKSGEGRLHITGRDLPEQTLAMTFEGGRWTCTGEAADDEAEADPLAAAKDFLREILKSGPVASDEIFKQGKAQGLTKKRIYEAKDALGIRARKSGFNAGWMWCLSDYIQESSGIFGGSSNDL